MATIKDIANLTGVSPTTVSRVLNFDMRLSVSDQTRMKILEVAESLDYMPPRQRHASHKYSPKVALVNWYDMKQELDDPYYLSIRMGIEQRALEEEILLTKHYSADGRFSSLGQDLDGIIAVGKYGREVVEELASRTANLVFVDFIPEPAHLPSNIANTENTEGFDCVITDFEKATYQALDYLTELGHTHIGFIGGRESVGDNQELYDEREKAFIAYYEKISREKGLPVHEAAALNTHIGSFIAESGYALMKNALQERQEKQSVGDVQNLPTAYLIASDSMAIGALRALYEEGMRVPQDISIISINDIPTAKYTVPQLTTIQVHKEHMGEVAVEMLLERIHGKRHISRKVVVPTKLIVRESTRRLEP